MSAPFGPSSAAVRNATHASAKVQSFARSGVHHRVGLRNRSAAAHRSVTLEAKREERSVYSIGAIPHAPCPSPNHHAAAPPGGVGGVDECAFDPLDAAAAIATSTSSCK